MIFIYTCPKCGHDLSNSIIATNPPIQVYECRNCGWSHEEEEREQNIRIPFPEENNTNYVADFGDGTITTNMATVNTIGSIIDNTINTKMAEWDIKDKDHYIGGWNIEEKNPCKNCNNNPKNGGSGICNCILGNMITW